MKQQRTRLVAASLTCAVIAVAVVGCAVPSFESIASECGGNDAGVVVDESAIAIEVERDTDALVCALPKIFPEKSDQYAVTLMVDEGEADSMSIDGRDVSFTSLAGSSVVLITAK